MCDAKVSQRGCRAWRVAATSRCCASHCIVGLHDQETSKNLEINLLSDKIKGKWKGDAEVIEKKDQLRAVWKDLPKESLSFNPLYGHCLRSPVLRQILIHEIGYVGLGRWICYFLPRILHLHKWQPNSRS